MAASSIVAHLIIGQKPEAYLSAALESIADVCDHLVVNDNSGGQGERNAEPLARSRLARSGRLTVIQTAFSDFATARNACLDATPAAYSSGWALFVDADEVHGAELGEMAALLSGLPEEVDAVDGYSRHFVGSFNWWIAMGRRLCLFRLAPQRRWYGKVHERLAPLRRRIVLPAVWFHYGHVVTPRAEADKSRLYASLDPGKASPSDTQIAGATAASVWSSLMRRARRFHGEHPAAMRTIIAQLHAERAALFDDVEALATRQTRLDRLRNALAHANDERLLAWRALDARVRLGWPHAASQVLENAAGAHSAGVSQTV